MQHSYLDDLLRMAKPKTKLSQADVAEIWSLRRLGHTHVAIAKQIGCTRQYIGMVLSMQRRFGDTVQLMDAQATEATDDGDSCSL